MGGLLSRGHGPQTPPTHNVARVMGRELFPWIVRPMSRAGEVGLPVSDSQNRTSDGWRIRGEGDETVRKERNKPVLFHRSTGALPQKLPREEPTTR